MKIDDYCKALTMLQEARRKRAVEKDIYAGATEDGWWGWDRWNDGEKIAKMHAELSRALEALRKGNPESEKIPGISAIEEALADTVIRILDFCGKHRFDLGNAVLKKLDYNKSRPRLHGKKF